MLDFLIGDTSYLILRILWWVLAGVLFVGFAAMDGHDMGVASLMPFIGKTDEERRAIINTIGPHWDGNQVWFITAGGALFAAWPVVYAVAFSGLYWGLLAVLWALFFRPVGFDYRSKINNPTWRNAWDWALFAGSFIPPIIFGVAFGNLLQGVPFHFDQNLRPLFDKGPFTLFFSLLNPFAILCGIVSCAMFLTHGAVFIALRNDGDVQARAMKVMPFTMIVTLLCFTLAGVWIALGGKEGYALVSGSFNAAAHPDPTKQEVVRVSLMHNFTSLPFLFIIPLLGYIGEIGAYILSKMGKGFWAFWSSTVGMLGIICTAGVAMFPFVMPSSSVPNHGLTLWNVTSSNYTLVVMTIVVLLTVPAILTYTGWCYYVMRGKVTTDFIRKNEHSAY